MDEYRSLIKEYLKSKDFDRQDNSKELNDYFNNDKIVIIKTNLYDVIEDTINQMQEVGDNDGISTCYLDRINDDLYSVFSCTGFSISCPVMDSNSKIKKSFLIDILRDLQTDIMQNSMNATDIIDKIELKYRLKLKNQL